MPGGEDFDQHYTAANQIRTLAEYHCDAETGILEINDPVWGRCEIGDQPGDEIFIDLFTNPLVQRLAGIEQLTLPKHFATMPGSFDLSRFEHAWGSVVFVRKMVERAREQGQDIDDRQALVWQLRTFVSDIGHTAFSHLGDWLFQGFGGTEDQHDDELDEILEVGGVNDILRQHGFNPVDIIFPEVNDWIECPGPDLCVDRVDYGAREISRWVSNYEPVDHWLDRFVLDGDKLVMKNQAEAKYFGVRFGLLATEHWGHPVHRFQLQAFAELVRSVIADGDVPRATLSNVYHPRDILYTVDSDIIGASRAVGSLNHDLYSVMLDIGRSQRKIFAHGRNQELERFHDMFREPEHAYLYESYPKEFPHPLRPTTWMNEYTGVKPYQLQFVEVEQQADVADFDQLPHTYDVFLPALKARFIDPLFYDEDGQVRRLSEADPEYKRLMEEQAAVQKQAYVARWYGDPEFISSLKSKIAESRAEWESKLRYERADHSRMREVFRSAGMLAIGMRGVRMSYY